MIKEKQEISNNPVDFINSGKELILFNDEFNTFEFVIDTLIEVCGHNPEQAEQCAFIAHTKGKCGIKAGELSHLKPLHAEMKQRGLITSIE